MEYIYTRSFRPAPQYREEDQKGAAAAARGPSPTVTLARLSSQHPPPPADASRGGRCGGKGRRRGAAQPGARSRRSARVHADLQEQPIWLDLAAPPAVPSPSLGFRGEGVMMLRMNGGGEGSDYGSSEAGSYEHEHGTTASTIRSTRVASMVMGTMISRLRDQRLAGRGACRGSYKGCTGFMARLTQMSTLKRQELVALGEVVDTESRGLSADTLASLASVTCNTKDMQKGNTEQCVIRRMEFEEGESLVALPCQHSYHPDCINQWLQINKLLVAVVGKVVQTRTN